MHKLVEPVVLTPRQYEIIMLISKGWYNKKIARELEITVRVVRSHLKFARDKNGAVTTGQLMYWIGQRGVVSSDERGKHMKQLNVA